MARIPGRSPSRCRAVVSVPIKGTGRAGRPVLHVHIHIHITPDRQGNSHIRTFACALHYYVVIIILVNTDCGESASPLRDRVSAGPEGIMSENCLGATSSARARASEQSSEIALSIFWSCSRSLCSSRFRPRSTRDADLHTPNV